LVVPSADTIPKNIRMSRAEVMKFLNGRDFSYTIKFSSCDAKIVTTASAVAFFDQRSFSEVGSEG
jgi:uncharacterized protein (UPF0147 family)